jgi:predicted XRE-type DNA-binding protein
MAISENAMSTYLHILSEVQESVEGNGKDFTQTQFAEMFGVSRKTFEGFYNGKIVRFDLLVDLANMYKIDIITKKI